MDGEPQGSP